MWPSHEKYSKRSGGEAWYMSYNGRHRNIVGRAYLMRHVY